MDSSNEFKDCENSESSIKTDSNTNETNLESKQPKKKSLLKVLKPKSCKRGIVYLSYIPEGMTARHVRELLSQYGEVERIYLEKDKLRRKNSKRNAHYTEGWIEFKKKSVAKMVANELNGKAIGGKRRSNFYYSLWSLKYLKQFKWSHLAEQMAYERALTEQKLRLEINSAKREATFYTEMIERSKRKKSIFNDPNRTYTQRPTEEQIIKQRSFHQTKELNDDFLENIFK